MYFCIYVPRAHMHADHCAGDCASVTKGRKNLQASKALLGLRVQRVGGAYGREVRDAK